MSAVENAYSPLDDDVHAKGLRDKVGRGLQNTKDFVRISPQKHLMSLVPGYYWAAAEYDAVSVLSKGHYIEGAAIAAIGMMYFVVVGAIERGAILNLRRYKRVRSALAANGWDERTIEPMLEWWCDRYAARQAAVDTGYKEEIKEYYKKVGASWFDPKR